MAQAEPPRPSDEAARRLDPRRADRRQRNLGYRHGDRRKVDRRAADLEAVVTSWFAGTDESLAETTLPADTLTDGAPTDPGRPARRGRPLAVQRILRVFLGARAALGVILVTMLAVTGLFGIRTSLLVSSISIGYAAFAISMWLLPSFGRLHSPHALARPLSPQWLATIGLDVSCFLVLHVMSPSAGFNYAALLVLPVMMAGVLTPRLAALATCAAVTLVLLGSAGLAVAAGGDPATLLTQSGLAGSGLFFIAVLAAELSDRLAREERSARGNRELARQQEQLNRLVIEEMQDGVLVVDARLRVSAANPAARRLMAAHGMCRPAPFDLTGEAAWQQLVAGVQRAFAEGSWPDEGRDLVLAFDPGLVRTVRMRVRFPRRGEPRAGGEHCVLLLEDLRAMQARVRQEKLAAMGRVSAGIAHEIRNPLAAISQANALMAEDATTPSQRQLTRMVTDNVERLKRIVDDVMEVAPGRIHEPGRIDLNALVASVCSDWSLAGGLPTGPQSPLRLDVPGHPLGAVFDAEHLRRVLVNLLDNALRHASGQPSSVVVRVYAPDARRAVLSVASDGPPIPPEVERHLFEPFYSTRSRGTGLGLYICRELCERYGAVIDYRARPASDANRNDFSVVMKRENLPAGEPALQAARP